MGTPWDVDGGVYDSKLLDLTGQESSVHAIAFSTDGTKLYAIGTANKTIYQYNLTTAWDISTASYASKSKDTSSETTNPSGLELGDSGTKAYVLDQAAAKIFQYNLSTAWDISTASYASKALTSLGTNRQGLSMSDDGTKAYVTAYIADDIKQYNLSTAWDISTGSAAGKQMSTTSEDLVPTNSHWHPDGDQMYVVGLLNGRVFQYNVGTPWDISTASYASKSLLVTDYEANPRGITFDEGGFWIYIVGESSSTVRQYKLAHPPSTGAGWGAVLIGG